MKFLPILYLIPSIASAAVTIDWVTVGNPGNAADATGYGAVSSTYNIGKYEVTNSQYAEFLNAVAKSDTYGLYNANMTNDPRGGIAISGVPGNFTYTVKSNMADKPVNYIGWHDAARFANWLHNGQPTGLQSASTTENGAYTLNGNTGLISRNVGATIWLPSESEWYKAAYHDPTPGASGNNYWAYPTQSDTAPANAVLSAQWTITNPGPNIALIAGGLVASVGGAGNQSFYGTFDQVGNVWEWTEGESGSSKVMRGSSSVNGATRAAATERGVFGMGEWYDVGFRLASVPEPDSAILIALFSAAAISRRKRANT